jgi:hypothetical protein
MMCLILDKIQPQLILLAVPETGIVDIPAKKKIYNLTLLEFQVKIADNVTRNIFCPPVRCI